MKPKSTNPVKDFPTRIFKILTPDEWAEFQSKEVFVGSTADRQDGFIHFSTSLQVIETANKHFSNEPVIWLLVIDTSRLDDSLKWEPSRHGDLFPHLYGQLHLSAVVDQKKTHCNIEWMDGFWIGLKSIEIHL